MKKFLHIFDNIINIISKCEIAISTFILMVMVIVCTFEIVGRNIFKYSILWANSLVLLLYVWFLFVGISYVYHKKEYISVSYFVKKLPSSIRTFIKIIVNILIIIFFAIILYYTPKLISLQMQRHVVLPVYRYMFTIPLVITSISIIIFTLHDTIKIIMEFHKVS